MSNHDFVFPEITDEDIREAALLICGKEDAFSGPGDDSSRITALKCQTSVDVAACPGSGKTTLLVAKLAILAAKWPHRTRGICVLSHTNEARRQIQKRLSSSPVGCQLLTYPHFIGTIHGFVNEYLAIPWLKSNGRLIRHIDTTYCENRRWAILPGNTKLYLKKKYISAGDVKLVDCEFGIAKKKGALPFGENTETYKHLVNAFRQTTMEGYYCHDDMFVWGVDLLEKHPHMTMALRDRFPLLFIDETQDNDDVQTSLLNKVFLDGIDPVLCQRFGDPNQAIFGDDADVAVMTNPFPSDATDRRISMPSSHRFGQEIADLAEPLGIKPYGMKGLGPQTPLTSGANKSRHTIFLFNEDSIGNVLPSYAELLLDEFSVEELRAGLFTAVGHTHKEKESNQMPHYIGHYHPAYSPTISSREPNPRNLAEFYELANIAKVKSNTTGLAVETIAAAVLRLANLLNKDVHWTRYRYRHRAILDRLNGNATLVAEYEAIIGDFLDIAPGSRVEVDEYLKDRFLNIAFKIAGTTGNTPEGVAFLNEQVQTSRTTEQSADIKPDLGNCFHYQADGKEVNIRLGSIHSVKGETHTATLVLETVYYKYNLESLKAVLLGENSDNSDRMQARRKTHYVAMTRPTHLLCLAMLRSSFCDRSGQLQQDEIDRLKQKGWEIRFV